MPASKIIVCCPHFVTGGPELLHQLVRALRDLGRDAYIAYLPVGPQYETPAPYKKYETPQAPLVDADDVLLIVPEPFTRLLRKLKRSKAVVWWLSVDNYYAVDGESRWADFTAKIKTALRGRLLPHQLRHYRHLAQSQYALEFLKSKRLAGDYLSDYLSREHFSARPAMVKEDIVVFKPKKGRTRTALLMAQNPGIRFVPLANLTPAGVADLLGRAKIYIDFGHHPGKDRAPREAVLAGCCVITGLHGAARNNEDLPIPARYKLDDAGAGYLRDFPPLAAAIFAEYEQHSAAFDAYRRKVAGEYERFQADVFELFGLHPGSTL